MSVICSKCGKKAMSGIPVTLTGKNGQIYNYTRYVLYIKERKRLPPRAITASPSPSPTHSFHNSDTRESWQYSFSRIRNARKSRSHSHFSRFRHRPALSRHQIPFLRTGLGAPILHLLILCYTALSKCDRYPFCPRQCCEQSSLQWPV